MGLVGDIVEAIWRAVSDIPRDVEEALARAYETEESELGRVQLKAILDNIKLARETRTPVCQDTGLLHFYVKYGVESGLSTLELEDAIKRAVKEATRVIPLRPNVVHPLSRVNTGDNVGVMIPVVEWEFTSGSQVEITVLPKGAGSENVSKAAVLAPAEGVKGVARFVLESVVQALGKPCPPVILGVGVGGSLEVAAKLAKRAHLRPIGARSRDPQVAELEVKLLEAVNRLGVGPMGLGGRWTALDVKVEAAHTHTASLPVAVSFQCWACRRASLTLTRA
ncbi:MAG: fumarate hydratase [Thermoprotei archaeon]|nr:MAG: fumarate hydratase [Thermoprotei archaeon]